MRAWRFLGVKVHWKGEVGKPEAGVGVRAKEQRSLGVRTFLCTIEKKISIW